MAHEIAIFPCLSDNYGVLLHDDATGTTAAIDAPEAEPILAALAGRGWVLSDILVTHHHKDHVQGIDGLRQRYPQARVSGPAAEAAKIGALDVRLGDNDAVSVGTLKGQVLSTPGHTAGHICYYFADAGLLFAGDTLFALGCGRVFETPLPVMWHSLARLRGLPPATKLYCGHEYTLNNGRFALGIEPNNAALQQRMQVVAALRAAGKPTVPSTLADELATNPFLRADDPGLQRAFNMTGAPPADVFAALRSAKDRA
ncbi:MAG: hydroxyacylglutathione hydrolase [Hyphomicrobiales bacterium]|nr:hydroxyacylglutathione hydrolase [Hyphomicrobiales bacterium]